VKTKQEKIEESEKKTKAIEAKIKAKDVEIKAIKAELKAKEAEMEQIQKDTPSSLYIRTKEGISPIASWDEFNTIWEDRHLNEDVVRIGYSDYSIEFIYDGAFLYPVDRDFPTERMDRTVSAEATYDYLASFGFQIDDFLKSLLPSESHISDSLNRADFSVEEIYQVSLVEQTRRKNAQSREESKSVSQDNGAKLNK